MFKLRKLLEKNFKLLWKSKLFVVTILIGPFIMAVLLGMAFNNTDVYSMTVGIYANNYGEIENDLVDKLGENFNVLKFNNEDSCVKTLKDDLIHACIILPHDIAFKTNEVNEIIFYVDNSRINLVWLILDTVSEALETSSSAISTDLTNELLLKLNKAGTTIVRLSNVTAQALRENNGSLGHVKQIDLEMGSLDSAETQERVEDSILKNKELERELNSFIKNINTKIDESKNILSGLNVNSPELDDVEEKMGEIEDIISESDNLLLVSELNGLLEDLDQDIFKIRETSLIVLGKNNENRDSLASTFNYLEQARGFIQEIDNEVHNLSVMNASKIVHPLRTEIRPIAKETTHFGFMYPTLIVLITLFVSIFFSSSMIIMERTSKAFFRNSVSSTSEVFFFIALFVTDLIIVLGSLSIFILFAKIFFGMPVNLLFFLVLFLIASLFILVGSFIGYIAKSEQNNILMGIIVSSTLVFFSNTIIPIESVSDTLKGVLQYNPVVIGEVMLRKLLIYKVSFGFLLNDLSLLFIYILVLVVILFLFLKFRGKINKRGSS